MHMAKVYCSAHSRNLWALSGWKNNYILCLCSLTWERFHQIQIYKAYISKDFLYARAIRTNKYKSRQDMIMLQSDIFGFKSIPYFHIKKTGIWHWNGLAQRFLRKVTQLKFRVKLIYGCTLFFLSLAKDFQWGSRVVDTWLATYLGSVSALP